MANSKDKAATPAFDPTAVVTKRKLVMPQLKLEQDVTVYFKVIEKMYVGKPNPEKPKDKPADLCHAIDLTSGEEVSVVIPAVLKSVWDEDYTDDGYVGLGFMVTKGAKAEGKRYFNYEVAEIEIPAV